MEKRNLASDQASGWDRINIRVRLAFCCRRHHNRDEGVEEDDNEGS